MASQTELVGRHARGILAPLYGWNNKNILVVK